MDEEKVELLEKEDKSLHDESQSEDFQKEEKVNVNKLKDGQQECMKCLYVVNKSKDAKVTLFIHPRYCTCRLLSHSKIIPPNQQHFHDQKRTFVFELVAILEDGRKIEEGPMTWTEDKKITVTDNLTNPTKPLDFTFENLVDFPEEKRLCLRIKYRKKELTHVGGMSEAYDVLRLDMETIRKMKTNDEQRAAIDKGYRQQIKIWHPDKIGDNEAAKEINWARDLLLDDKQRIRYHKEVDYDKGWLSSRRFKAIFCPDSCLTKKQSIAHLLSRLGLIAISLGALGGGVALSLLTAGAATPVWVIFGTALAGGGLQSLKYTVSKDAAVNRIEPKKWLSKVIIGSVGGAVTGGAAVGITAAVAGFGSAALESGAVTLAQYVGIGAATGAVGGASSSLTSTAVRIFVDEEKLSTSEILVDLGCAVVIGAAAGAIGGIVTKSVVNRQTSATTVNLQGDAGEQAAMLTAGRRLANRLGHDISRELTEGTTEAIAGTAVDVVKERVDDNMENQGWTTHAQRGLKNVVTNVAMRAQKTVAGSLASHWYNETNVNGEMKKHTVSDEVTHDKIRYDLFKKNNEHRVNWNWTKGSSTYEPTETHQPKVNDDKSKQTYEGGEEEPQEGSIKLISKGAWFSKMIVTYCLHGKKTKKPEKDDSKKLIKIPAGATQIEVKFQVRRPFWGDIIKYDRFKKIWCKPYEPHVFRYKEPPVRTFTISGNLWWEAVMTVSNEYHDETGEMS